MVVREKALLNCELHCFPPKEQEWNPLRFSTHVSKLRTWWWWCRIGKNTQSQNLKVYMWTRKALRNGCLPYANTRTYTYNPPGTRDWSNWRARVEGARRLTHAPRWRGFKGHTWFNANMYTCICIHIYLYPPSEKTLFVAIYWTLQSEHECSIALEGNQTSVPYSGISFSRNQFLLECFKLTFLQISVEVQFIINSSCLGASGSDFVAFAY